MEFSVGVWIWPGLGSGSLRVLVVLLLGDVALRSPCSGAPGCGAPWPSCGLVTRVVAAAGWRSCPASRAASQGRRSAAQRSGRRAAAGVVVAEVGLGGLLDPVGAVAEVDLVQVLGEDLVLVPVALELVGERGLAELLEDGPALLRAKRVLDELLGDRGRTLAARPCGGRPGPPPGRCPGSRRRGARRSAGPRSRPSPPSSPGRCRRRRRGCGPRCWSGSRSCCR